MEETNSNIRSISEEELKDRVKHDTVVDESLDTMRTMRGKIIKFTRELDDEIYNKTSTERKNCIKVEEDYYFKLKESVKSSLQQNRIKIDENLFKDILFILDDLYLAKFGKEEMGEESYEALMSVEGDDEFKEKDEYDKLCKYGISKEIVDKIYNIIKTEVQEVLESKLAYNLSILTLLQSI